MIAPKAAPHPVHCESGGKHIPRTVENVDPNGVHIKTSVCHDCQRVA